MGRVRLILGERFVANRFWETETASSEVGRTGPSARFTDYVMVHPLGSGQLDFGIPFVCFSHGGFGDLLPMHSWATLAGGLGQDKSTCRH